MTQADLGAFRLLAVTNTFGMRGHTAVVLELQDALLSLGIQPTQMNVLLVAGHGDQEAWDRVVASAAELWDLTKNSLNN